MKRDAASIAIIYDGLREIHATDAQGIHSTLCGLDGNDPGGSVDQTSGGPVKRGEKIDCRQCRQIFEHVRRYKASDFAGDKRGIVEST